MSEWDQFPVAGPAQDPWAEFPAVPVVSTGEDVVQGFGGGIERGLVGAAGLPGSIAQMARTGADIAARQTVGRLFNRFAPGGTGDWSPDTRPDPGLAPDLSAANLPSSAELNDAWARNVHQPYQAQTGLGKFAGGVGEAVGGGAVAPGPALGKLAISGVSGVASEAAGKATEGTPFQGAAQLAAGLLTPYAAARTITPMAVSPRARANDPLVARLEAEGIKPSAGARTGSKVLQSFENATESIPFGPKSLAETENRNLNRAVSKRIGEDAELLTEDVRKGAAQRLGKQYEDLSARNTLVGDRRLANDIQDTIQKYHVKLPVARKPEFEAWVRGISDDIQRNGGVMPGPVYQQTRSDLTTIARSAKNDPTYEKAIRGLRDALDKAMERSVRNPDDAALWKQTNREYANLKAVNKAMDRVGAEAAAGYLSPGALKSATRDTGTDDLRGLASAAQLLRAPPSSGTAERSSALQKLGSGIGPTLGAGIGGTMGNLPGAVAGAAAGAAVPALLSHALMSRPMQSWLGNRMLDPNMQASIHALLNTRKGLEQKPIGLLSR